MYLMAKELPYFQFEVSEYLNGDIQYCSLEAQGLFINICSMYWHRSCELTTMQIIKRFPKSDKAHKELIDEGIITNDQDLVIKFLDEQFVNLQSRKKRLSDAGKKGAAVRKEQALNKPPLSLEQATLKQPEEKREEERRREEINLSIESSFKDKVCRQLCIDSEEYLSKWNEFSIANDLEREEKEVKKHFFNWLKTQNLKTNEPKKFDPYG